MPRTTTDPRTEYIRVRVTKSVAESLRKSAEALRTTKTAIVVRGVGLVEAEIAKGQAPSKS